MRHHTIDLSVQQFPWRRARQLGAGALAILVCGGPAVADASAARCAGASEPPASGTRARTTAAVVCVVNHERAKRELPRLRARSTLGLAASRHARDMVRRRFFAHTSPEGTTMIDRLRAVGYVRDSRPWAVGETLAWGTGTRATPAAVVDAWLASPPHRRVLLSDDYRDVGIGVVPDLPFDDDGDAPRATYAADLGVRP
jgi:uncharacterized protein YkwD